MNDRRSWLIVVLVLGVLVLAALTTWRSIAVERSHRAASQRFVQDIAVVVADDVLRRSVFEFEVFGFSLLRRELAETAEARNLLLEPHDLRASDKPPIRSASKLVDETFLVNFAKQVVVPPVSPGLRQWLFTGFERIAIERRRGEQTPMVRAHGRTVVYAAGRLDDRLLIGFSVRREGLSEFMRNAMARRPPVPSMLGSRLANDEVFLRVVVDGRELFRTKGAFDPDYGRRFIAPDSYGDILGGAAVECSIARAAVPRIVAGGVPPPRWIEPVAMLAMTIALLAAVLWIVRRERQLNALRSDFVSGVSHELRTPLTQIRMFTETLLLERVRSSDERTRSLQIINQETGRLTNLVDNLLFFTRGERAMLHLARTEEDLTELARQTVRSMCEIARARGATINVHGEPVIAPVDADAFRQMLINLLDNALKYGPQGQTIEVDVSRNGAAARVAVADRGPGIPADERERVWEKFFRLERDRGTHKAGSGIGLAVVRDLVLRHGGTCRVEDHEGGGARFVLELPMADEEEEERLDAHSGH